MPRKKKLKGSVKATTTAKTPTTPSPRRNRCFKLVVPTLPLAITKEKIPVSSLDSMTPSSMSIMLTTPTTPSLPCEDTKHVREILFQDGNTSRSIVVDEDPIVVPDQDFDNSDTFDLLASTRPYAYLDSLPLDHPPPAFL